MKTLTIRQVDEEAHEGLRVHAAKAGKSVEEVMREVIAERFGPKKEKPDLRPLHALRAKIKKSLPPDAPSAMEMVRQFRDDEIAASDAKRARIDTDLGRKKKTKKTAK